MELSHDPHPLEPHARKMAHQRGHANAGAPPRSVLDGSAAAQGRVAGEGEGEENMSDLHEDDDQPDDDDLDDCGLMPNGQCLYAGTEQCDWLCKMRDSEFYAMRRA